MTLGGDSGRVQERWGAEDFEADEGADLAEWRGRVLDAFLWMAVAVAFVGGALGTLEARSTALGATVVAVGGLELGAALRTSLGYRLRARILLGGIFAGNTALLAIDRGGPVTLCLMLLFALQATLLLGRRWGLASSALSALALAGVSELRRRGAVGPALDMSATTLARTTIDFAVLAVVGVLSVAYLLEHAERILSEKGAAIRALAREERAKVRACEELRAREESLRAARELEILGRLAGAVAHDFNNALLVIQSNVDLARHDRDVERAFAEISAAVQHAAATTRELRAFGPRRARPPMPLALDEVVQRAALLLGRVLPKSVRVEASIEESLVIRADEGQILGAVAGLALNARDAMPEAGRIVLRLRRASEPGAPKAAAIDVVAHATGAPDKTLESLYWPLDDESASASAVPSGPREAAATA